MQVVIDTERETFEEIENDSYEVAEIVHMVAGQIEKGYSSGIEPSFYIHDESEPDTMYWLKMMRDQMRNGYHISKEDMKRIVQAVDEIEALRDKMLKEAK